ncbi:hypothetical protein [Dechloromonas denitrificans]|uniref:hypothetical protein n=1 Tax=Dechloromonas denitrificans TaxID=281362 RepID=UPI001CFA9A29|nr:hypothetical protein [Dechloromonas denitrificans]UCV08563.1 hypothetical protein KI615_03255 [Dechloromonas denitrificans]
MGNAQSNKGHWVIDNELSKSRLKKLACDLDQELTKAARQSKLLADLSKFEPLASAIARAVEMKIEHAEEVPGISYWYMHTDLQGVISMTPSLSKFLFALECWRFEEPKVSEELKGEQKGAG